jgi:hypothetical protein
MCVYITMCVYAIRIITLAYSHILSERAGVTVKMHLLHNTTTLGNTTRGISYIDN